MTEETPAHTAIQYMQKKIEEAIDIKRQHTDMAKTKSNHKWLSNMKYITCQEKMYGEQIYNI